VPPIVLALAKHPMVDDYDISSLRTIMCAAAPLKEELQMACALRLNIFVKQAWGMTELSPIGTAVPDPEGPYDTWDVLRETKAVAGSSGELAPATQGKLVCPESGRDMAWDEEGELLVRGPQTMLGYLNNEAATAATIRADGWMHTGDVATFNAHGRMFITDRCKELIKYKGFQVAPAELEDMIMSMDKVGDVIVIPVEDEEAGELPRAYVVHPCLVPFPSCIVPLVSCFEHPSATDNNSLTLLITHHHPAITPRPCLHQLSITLITPRSFLSGQGERPP
jgi:acyl-CoA synthetase (AMP-forming)/AMP-acid ligase II